jgi:hypothetical protein
LVSDLSTDAQLALNALANSSTIAITFGVKKCWNELIQTFQYSSLTLGLKSYLTKVFITSESATSRIDVSEDDVRSICETSTGKRFVVALRVLDSLHYSLNYTKDSVQRIRDHVIEEWLDLLRSKVNDKRLNGIITAVQRVSEIIDNMPMWTDIYQVFVSLLRAQSENTDIDDLSDDEYMLVNRVVVTPSASRFTAPVPIKTNRLLRKFKESVFLYMNFRDDDGDRIFDNNVFQDRFRNIIEHGIPILGEWRCMFLLCSASQLRERNGIGIIAKSSRDCDEIREALWPGYESANSYAKQMSRLGLYCSSDSPTFDDSEFNLSQVDDWFIDPAKRRGILTDGAGFISETLMNDIKSKFPLLVSRDSCALQIRHRGYKGVLCVTTKPSDRCIVYRNSMKKFESVHSTLCVTKACGYVPLKLNREILNLLFSLGGEGVAGGDWSPLNHVRNLQNRALQALASSLTDQKSAVQTLADVYLPGGNAIPLAIFDAGVNILTEPFWAIVLRVAYHSAIRAIRAKSHIPIDGGCRVTGIPDSCNVLNDGEVFLRVKRPMDSIARVITGPVLICRNPCLDPGDIRKVIAVDIPDLYMYENLIVLPAQNGVTTRSLSAE